MYKLVLIVSGLLLALSSPRQEKTPKTPSSPAPTEATFGIKDVIDMLQAKVPEEVVIGQIIKAHQTFTLSTQDLIALSKAGASERVLHQLDPSISTSKPPENSARVVTASQHLWALSEESRRRQISTIRIRHTGQVCTCIPKRTVSGLWLTSIKASPKA